MLVPWCVEDDGAYRVVVCFSLRELRFLCGGSLDESLELSLDVPRRLRCFGSGDRPLAMGEAERSRDRRRWLDFFFSFFDFRRFGEGDLVDDSVVHDVAWSEGAGHDEEASS